MTIFLIKIFCWNGPEILWLELLKKCFYSYIKIMEQINLSPPGTLSLLLSLYLVVIFGHTHTIRTIYSSHSRSNSMSKNVMFTVLQLFRSSYKVKFGHLYSVILTILRHTPKKILRCRKIYRQKEKKEQEILLNFFIEMRKPKQQEGLNFSNNSLPKTESLSMTNTFFGLMFKLELFRCVKF